MIPDAVHKKAAEHFGETIGVRELAANVFEAWSKDARDKNPITLIVLDGKVLGPRDAGFGPAAAWRASGALQRLPDDARLAAELFVKTTKNIGALVLDGELMRAANGTQPAPPSAKREGDELVLHFWTLAIRTFHRFEVIAAAEPRVRTDEVI